MDPPGWSSVPPFVRLRIFFSPYDRRRCSLGDHQQFCAGRPTFTISNDITLCFTADHIPHVTADHIPRVRVFSILESFISSCRNVGAWIGSRSFMAASFSFSKAILLLYNEVSVLISCRSYKLENWTERTRTTHEWRQMQVWVRARILKCIVVFAQLHQKPNACIASILERDSILVPLEKFRLCRSGVTSGAFRVRVSVPPLLLLAGEPDASFSASFLSRSSSRLNTG